MKLAQAQQTRHIACHVVLTVVFVTSTWLQHGLSIFHMPVAKVYNYWWLTTWRWVRTNVYTGRLMKVGPNWAKKPNTVDKANLNGLLSSVSVCTHLGSTLCSTFTGKFTPHFHFPCWFSLRSWIYITFSNSNSNSSFLSIPPPTLSLSLSLSLILSLEQTNLCHKKTHDTHTCNGMWMNIIRSF